MPTWLPPPPVAANRPAPRWRRLASGLAVAVGVGVLLAAVVGFAVVRPRIFRIQGQAMSPTLRDDDRLVMRRATGRIGRGTIVALRYPKNPAKLFVMRVVGLPGERVAIRAGLVEIDGRPIAEPYVVPEQRSYETFGQRQLGADEYFVLGDNRRNASDSREWGPVPRRYLVSRMGIVWYRRP